MPKIGIAIRVIYPDYVAGMQGIIQGKESSGRWIVQLNENPFKDSEKPLVLSLEESDFEIIAVSEEE
ncbi:hypothetical protein PCC7424_2549 [Gloeothece citriformis PCC 7424]|uniref:Uncharacterized protein n=1 Tax=Gloeothece citriformis (strain PCC 7424) TaxID=65393 RepID=B7KK80_GLOC7|nr:hypothetical protein [Gloeothece citriformis]ACK70965.1 hypothetical protein PCC7424_2549 [Gloeothece citriformis PCC 7424]